MAPPEPSSSRPDALVINQEDREDARSASRWESLRTFHRAPCLLQSIGLGVSGGLGLGALRYMTYRNRRTAFTWGAVVGGLLYGTSWYVCRRAMYQRVEAEASLLQRVAERDPAALEEYQRKLEQRERAASRTA